QGERGAMLYHLFLINSVALCLGVAPAAFADDANSGSNPHAVASPESTDTPAARATEGKSQGDTGTGGSAEEQVGQLRKDLDKARDALIDFGKKFAEAAKKEGGIDDAGLEEIREQFKALKEKIKGLQDRSDNFDQLDSSLLSKQDRDHLDRLNKIIAKLDEKLNGPDPKQITDVEDVFAQFHKPTMRAQMQPELPEEKTKPSNEG